MSDKAKHVPGPWKAVNKGQYWNNPKIDMWDVEHANDGEVVCDDIIASGCYTEANAHLIASAPDLLEVMMFVEAHMESYKGSEAFLLKAMVRDVIAKATNEE